jgi:heme exporter protein B
MLKITWLFFYTELMINLRRSQDWLHPLGFFSLVIILFPLAFTPDPTFLKKYLPGGIWLAALLASLMSIESIFLNDLEDGHLEQIRLSQISLTWLILIKTAAHWLVTEMPLILLTICLSILFHFPLHTIFILCISLLLGTPILVLIGALIAALTLNLRHQGVLLGLIILPLVTPVLIFGVNITQQSQTGLPIAGSIAFLAGLSLLAITLLPFAIAATIRISMDD